MEHQVRDQETLQKVGRRLVSLRLARPLLPLLLAVLATAGCASYTDETREIRSLYASDQYRAALTKLEASALKDESKNRLLYRLEKAMILERLGEGGKARATLIDADRVADDLYTTSITRTAASFIVSESSTDYDGEDYERVAIHTMLALSYLHDKDLQNARVEARKISLKLEEINKNYEDNKNRYSEDGFARYLAGMIYEAKGELDDALIDYGKALQAYQGSFAVFAEGPPAGLVKAYARLLLQRNRPDKLAKLEKDFPKAVAEARASLKDDADTGEVVVVHELGHIATKTARDFFLPIGKQVVRFSFPVIVKRNDGYAGQTGLAVQGKFVGADNAEDLDSIARDTLEDRRLRMIAKSMVRLLAKGQLTEQAYKNFGPLGGIAANVFSAVTETADTRSWTLLPAAFYVSRLRLKPGIHTIEVKSGGRTSDIKSVDVKRGQITFLRDVG